MEDLRERLDEKKWVKMDVSKKKDFREYQVTRQHTQLSPTSYGYIIIKSAEEEAKKVVLEFTATNKDPLKDIGTVQLLLNDNKVVGIDLDGDCYQQK